MGVPSYATPEQIHAAYLQRLKVLKTYHFDKTKQPDKWAAVNEIVEELHQAYAKLLCVNPNPVKPAEATPVTPPAPLYKLDTEEKSLSHREITEKAVRAYQKLTESADASEAQTKFIELIATRGFSDSQHLPHVNSTPKSGTGDGAET